MGGGNESKVVPGDGGFIEMGFSLSRWCRTFASHLTVLLLPHLKEVEGLAGSNSLPQLRSAVQATHPLREFWFSDFM